jgi:hypothetical protein
MKSWVSSAFDTNQSSTRSSSSSSLTNKKFDEKTQQSQPSQRSSQRSANNKATTSKVVSEKCLMKFAQTTNNLLLSEKYKPTKRIDLVVNKTKVDQFSNLLDEIFKRDKGSILLVQGPSGCGKLVR